MKNVFNCIGHKLNLNNIVKAENAFLYASNGQKYLDLESGVWCTVAGHCHPRLSQVIAAQSQKIIHTGFCYLNPIVNKAAAKLLSISGINQGKCVFYSPDGSCDLEAAPFDRTPMTSVAKRLFRLHIPGAENFASD